MQTERIKDILTDYQQGKVLQAFYGLDSLIKEGFYLKDTYYLYAQMLSALGRHKEAIDAYEEELKRQPASELSKNALKELKAALTQEYGSRRLKDRKWNSTIPKQVLDQIQHGLHEFHYKDVPLLKNPFDFALYQMLIWDYKPGTIIEIGSKFGGSAFWMGDLLDQFKLDAHVHSVDIVKVEDVEHPRVTFYKGDGRNLDQTFSKSFLAALKRPLLVIEDADHTYETSKAVLEFFDPVLESDEMIIIEDGIITDLGGGHLSGPHRALKEFVEAHPEYQIESRYCDFFGYNATWNTNGFLRKTGKEKSTIPQENDALAEVQELIDQGNFEQAFARANQLKSEPGQRPNLDFLRAQCFLRMGRKADAIQALREELTHNPAHSEASNLLSQLDKPANLGSNYPDEFKQLYQLIRPYTMLSVERLYQLYESARKVCQSFIGGNFVECGVARGGSAALLAWVSARYSNVPRKVFAFDSFEGMPTPDANDTHEGIPAEDTGWGTGTINAPEETLLELAQKLGVANHIEIVKGWFQETLPSRKKDLGMIALLHADGDWYASTKTIFEHLYDRVQPQGIVQIDDYGYWEGCAKAVHEFQEEHGIRFELKRIDATGHWFTKTESPLLNPKFKASLVSEFEQFDPEKLGILSQMSLNERLQFYYALKILVPEPKTMPIRFLEIGSFSGASMVEILTALAQRFGDQVEGFVIEPEGSPQFHQLLQQFKGKLIHLRDYSTKVDAKLSSIFDTDGNRPLFMFIDGDHSYEGVREDMLKYYPMLEAGGIIVFHDYLPPLDENNRESILHHHGGKEPGIRQACHEIMEAHFKAELMDIPIPYPAYPEQTQAQLPVIPGVSTTLRVYRKPE